LISLTFSSHSE